MTYTYIKTRVIMLKTMTPTLKTMSTFSKHHEIHLMAQISCLYQYFLQIWRILHAFQFYHFAAYQLTTGMSCSLMILAV